MSVQAKSKRRLDKLQKNSSVLPFLRSGNIKIPKPVRSASVQIPKDPIHHTHIHKNIASRNSNPNPNPSPVQ